jgi:adenosylhomocysteinase
MTSRDYEFPLADWAKRAERIIDYGTLGHGYRLPHGVELCVIGDGLPVNFHHRESLPNRVIDVVFAALLLGGATLVQTDQGGHGAGCDVALVDRILAGSPALDAYLKFYADDAAERSLLTPSSDHCPDYTRSPWRYGTP